MLDQIEVDIAIIVKIHMIIVSYFFFYKVYSELKCFFFEHLSLRRRKRSPPTEIWRPFFTCHILKVDDINRQIRMTYLFSNYFIICMGEIVTSDEIHQPQIAMVHTIPDNDWFKLACFPIWNKIGCVLSDLMWSSS